jgi:tryptophan-rich sensory protein
MFAVTWPWAKPKDNYYVLAGFIFLCQAAGVIGTVWTISNIPTWYAYLHKPPFSPPNWLFGPVWLTLYTCMGIAAYLIWRKYQFGKKAQDFWRNFWIQLILNALWTPVFFGLHAIGFAYWIIIAMDFFIYQTMRTAYSKSPAAAYLLLPYFAWVTFASLLNFAIAVLN